MNQLKDLNCQRCNQNLTLHPSLTLPNLSSFHELLTCGTNDSQLLNLESFQDLSQAEAKVSYNGEIRQIHTASKLFDILSDQSDIDHPLCQECSQFILDQMDNQLLQLEQECKENRQFALKQAAAMSSSSNSLSDATSQDSNISPTSNSIAAHQHHAKKCDIENLKKEIKALQNTQNDLICELKQIEQEQLEVENQIVEIQNEKQLLEQQNLDFWTEYNNVKQSMFKLEDDMISTNNRIAYYKNRKDRLNNTNVLNKTFHIWHAGQFGQFATINGFRLGRLPKEPVSWDEINAAWGQCVLLLHCLAKKIGLKFKRYKLVPYGNNSFIESLDNKSRELPLYGSGGFKFIWTAKFDQAMIAFLDCLQQFKERVEKDEPNVKLPYKMERGKMIVSAKDPGYSIKMQTNSEEDWTKALKYMLTNLKWSLAYVVSNYDL